MLNNRFGSFLIFICCCAISMQSCKEAPVQISPEVLSILEYAEEVQLETNLDVRWEISDPNAGTISNQGKLKAGDSAGVFTLMAISKSDDTNQASITFRVSPKAEHFNALLQGGHVIYLRHAIAARGSDQLSSGAPGWHLSCDESIARQISEPQGVDQAKALGEAFKSLRIPLSDTIYTSEYCRCIQTAELMDLGKARRTDSAVTYYVYDENLRHQRTKAFIDAFPVSDKNVLVVSHSFGAGSDYPQVSQGYSAVFIPGGTGPTFVTILTDEDWIMLK